jgi:hypothetical protein
VLIKAIFNHLFSPYQSAKCNSPGSHTTNDMSQMEFYKLSVANMAVSMRGTIRYSETFRALGVPPLSPAEVAAFQSGSV